MLRVCLSVFLRFQQIAQIHRLFLPSGSHSAHRLLRHPQQPDLPKTKVGSHEGNHERRHAFKKTSHERSFFGIYKRAVLPLLLRGLLGNYGDANFYSKIRSLLN